MYPFFERKASIESLNQDVRILSGTLYNVIGLNLAGSDVSPFLLIMIVHAIFHSFGILPNSHTIRITSAMKDLR